MGKFWGNGARTRGGVCRGCRQWGSRLGPYGLAAAVSVGRDGLFVLIHIVGARELSVGPIFFSDRQIDGTFGFSDRRFNAKYEYL